MHYPCNHIKININAHDQRLERTRHKRNRCVKVKALWLIFFPLVSSIFCNILYCLHKKAQTTLPLNKVIIYLISRLERLLSTKALEDI